MLFFISILIFILCCIFICRCSSFCCCPSSLTLPWTIAGFLHPFLYFQPSPSQSNSRHFHFQPFRYLLAASATAFSEHFLPTGVFYLALLHRHFNMHLSRLPWGPAVLPCNLLGFILILESQSRPICLFDSQ